MNFNPKSVIGGIPGLFEDFEFERESSIVSSVAEGVLESITSLAKDVTGTEKSESSESSHSFPSKGSIEFNKKQQAANEAENKQRADVKRKETFFQALKEDQERAQRAKDILWFEEEINDLTANMPEDQKNALLHYQASYKDRSVYQKSELRKKIIEQKQKQEEQEKAASIPSPAKQANALETQFEGGTGAYGTGSANLSSATGAVG